MLLSPVPLLGALQPLEDVCELVAGWVLHRVRYGSVGTSRFRSELFRGREQMRVDFLLSSRVLEPQNENLGHSSSTC